MNKLILHIKLWNSWRKRSLNGNFYKLLVLFGLTNSPTFMVHKTFGSSYIPQEFKYKEIREVEYENRSTR